MRKKINKMKHITVSGAIILRTNPATQQKEIFATQRGYGDFKGGWEICLFLFLKNLI
jgi:hypothetical protein